MHVYSASKGHTKQKDMRRLKMKEQKKYSQNNQNRTSLAIPTSIFWRMKSQYIRIKSLTRNAEIVIVKLECIKYHDLKVYKARFDRVKILSWQICITLGHFCALFSVI